jgi:hypothetical protein
MAEGSGGEENSYSFHSYTRKNERKSVESNDDKEEDSVKPDLGLGNTQTSEKKLVTESHGPGKHSTNLG